MFTTEAKEIDSLAVKNRKIGELWRGLSIDEKEKYYMLAKEESTYTWCWPLWRLEDRIQNLE